MTHFIRFVRFLCLVFILTLFQPNPTLAQSGIIVVNSSFSYNPSCPSVCTLAKAIEQSNTTTEVETIQFNIPGTGPFTILTNPGFVITKSVIIDATTQPGYSDKPVIEIRQGNTNAPYGFSVVAPSVTIRGLAITGFVNGPGILLGGGQNHLIEKNYIGVDVTGTIAQPNDSGLIVRSPNNIIRDNVISGNNNTGIYLYSNGGNNGTNNLIAGNFIGTNYNGTTAIPNQDGISLREGGNDNTIGGVVPSDRNIISGNTRYGIFTDGRDSAPSLDTHGTIILGNYIGVDVTGTLDLGNGSVGIFIDRSDDNIIGGITGTSPGGSCTGACNLISGNNSAGINIIGDTAGTSENNLVQGNFVGTDVSGTLAIPNGNTGISIGSSKNILGGTTPSARNLISGNVRTGVSLAGQATFENIIRGNYIGTDTSGLNPLGNGAFGILINAGAFGNQIGDRTEVGANRIAFNGTVYVKAGIGIDNTQVNSLYAHQNLITGNAIYSNAALGIDLLPEGITVNDPNDVDVGANGLQNFPILSEVITTETETVVVGALDGVPNRAYAVDLYYNTACDASGNGEGQFYIGSVASTSGPDGKLPFALIGISPPLPPNAFVTALAIDQDGTVNSSFRWNTSEFSPCQTAKANLGITKVNNTDPVFPGDNLTYTITISNLTDEFLSDAQNVVVSDTLPAGLTYSSANTDQGTCDYNISSRNITCSLGRMVDNTSVTITVETVVDIGVTTPTISNTASVTSDVTDPDTSNNSAAQTTRIAQSNLSLTMTDTPDPIPVDGLLKYTLLVKNLGIDTATQVVLTDTLPANMSLISATAAQGTCSPNSGSVTCDLGTIPNGSSTTVSILTRPLYQALGTTLTNTATVSALQVDTQTANNTVSAKTLVSGLTGAPSLYVFETSTPVLTWGSIPGATAYEIEVDDNPTFLTPNFEDNDMPPSQLSASTSPLADGIWYWRVRAGKPGGLWGGWSTTGSFMIDQP
ncbi:MAG TPA: hypothetical protein VHO69_11215 [Phototrophicaceae bacterium]|nr:hypothetical protein [Phototrophicaceae bacterium]